MPTRSRSRFASAQKQPCALRYSGQMPGCSTNVPARAIEKIAGLRMTLQRAITRSGCQRVEKLARLGAVRIVDDDARHRIRSAG